MDTLFGFGWLPKIIIFGISIAFFWKKNMFCFLSMFLNNVEKNGKNIYSYIYTFKKIVFKVNIHNLPQFFNHTVALVQNKNNERISLE